MILCLNDSNRDNASILRNGEGCKKDITKRFINKSIQKLKSTWKNTKINNNSLCELLFIFKHQSMKKLNTGNQKAFTLVELIVVITILAILATIAFISL